MQRNVKDAVVFVENVACSIFKVDIIIRNQKPFGSALDAQILNQNRDIIKQAEADTITSSWMMITAAYGNSLGRVPCINRFAVFDCATSNEKRSFENIMRNRCIGICRPIFFRQPKNVIA